MYQSFGGWFLRLILECYGVTGRYKGAITAPPPINCCRLVETLGRPLSKLSRRRNWLMKMESGS